MKKIAAILISVPHGGDQIPGELIDRCALGRRALFDDSDAFTRQLFDFKSRVLAYVDSPFYRTLIDLNRDIDNKNHGETDGIIKSKTAKGVVVFKKDQYPKGKLIEDLLKKYYYPYHEAIEDQINRESFLFALDCHSMDPVGPSLGVHPGKSRPTFCLSNGGDSSGFPIGKKGPTTCPPSLIINFAECLAEVFKIPEEQVQLNDPFPGDHIIKSHFRDSVPWIQLEVNKSMYLDFSISQKSYLYDEKRITKMREKIWFAIQKLINIVDT